MGMAQPDARLEAAPDLSCCQLTTAPLPEARGQIAVPQVPADVLVTGPPLFASIPPAHPVAPEFPPAGSPPDLQPLLCVFLI